MVGPDLYYGETGPSQFSADDSAALVAVTETLHKYISANPKSNHEKLVAYYYMELWLL